MAHNPFYPLAAFVVTLREYLDLSAGQVDQLFQCFLGRIPQSLREQITAVHVNRVIKNELTLDVMRLAEEF
jgi:hypothetical protein